MNITLDRRSKTPLSQQLEIELRLKMIRGELQQNSLMPSPDLLALECGISPDQVIEAYDRLNDSNHLIRKGETWVVGYGRITKNVFEKFLPLYEILKQFGSTPKIETLAIKKDYKLPKTFDIDVPFKKILFTRRLYTSHDRPQAIIDCYFLQDLFPGMEKLLETNEPYYSLIRSRYGIEFGRSERTVEAENLRKREAEILNVPAGTSYCYSIVKTYDASDRLIEVDVCWILPDLMHFTIEQDE